MFDAELSIVSMLYLLGAVQGVLLCGALLTSHKGLKKANRFLAALVFVFTLDMVSFFLDEIDPTEQWIRLQIAIFPREFFYGVFFYFYVRELTQPGKYLIHYYQWLHFLPSVIYIMTSWSLLLLDADRLLAYAEGELRPEKLWLPISIVTSVLEMPLSLIHVAIYFWFSYRLINRHQQAIKATFSYTENISLKWLKTLIIMLACIYCLWLLDIVLSRTSHLGEFSEPVLGLSIVLLIYAMGYMGLRQPLIFTGADFQAGSVSAPLETAEIIVAIESDSKIQSRTSSIDNDTLESLFNELEATIQTEQLYLKNDLSLAELAHVLGLSTHYLSEVINTKTPGNFYEYINRYRVEYAKTLLNDQIVKLTVLEVAMQSGFNSKSAFYTAFKKQLSMTPSEYKAQSKSAE